MTNMALSNSQAEANDTNLELLYPGEKFTGPGFEPAQVPLNSGYKYVARRYLFVRGLDMNRMP
jgi:hypothetical protein